MTYRLIQERFTARAWTGAPMVGLDPGFECSICKDRFRASRQSVCRVTGCPSYNTTVTLIACGVFDGVDHLEAAFNGDMVVTSLRTLERKVYSAAAFAATFEVAP